MLRRATRSRPSPGPAPIEPGAAASARVPHARLLAREPLAAMRIPYTAQLTDSVVLTRDGHCVFTLQLAGASFDTADDVEVNAWHERLNGLLRNIAAPNLAIWTHIVRRRDASRLADAFPPGFAADLARRYRRRLATRHLMVNDLYLSVVLRAAPGLATAWAVRLLARTDRRALADARSDALEQCAKLQQQLLAALAPYGARLLGLTHRPASDAAAGVAISEPLTMLGALVNGEAHPMPLARAPLNAVLATSRPFFGAEALEYRTPTDTRVAAMLAIKEYSNPSSPDMFHRLLAAPFPFVLTQSFTFLAKSTAQSLLQRQYNQMVNAGDLARSQAEELKDALDALAGNDFVMGDHHFTLQVLADPTEAAASDDPAPRLRELAEHIAAARELLADTGMVVAREDLALEAAFWAQLPGNFAYRPRKAPITSRNFAAMSPLHNYPTGRAQGNHWGEALAMLTTRANAPYFFSLHAGAHGEAGPQDVGHTLVCGPTGSGKTVFLGFCIAMMQKLQATQVIFDKDRGLEILVRALGGTYLPLRTGVPTGMNPLRLDPTAANVAFLKDWLRTLVTQSGAALTVREEADLEQALRGVLALEAPARRLSRVLEFLDASAAEGLYPRLARWCHAAQGELAWVFDHDEDEVTARLAASPLVGVDVTEFLALPAVRTPVTMVLFHLVRALLDGRPFVCWCDEFWRLLDDPAFEDFARDGPKTWRKLNGVFAAATQSAADVLASPIARTLVEQTPTKVFFPNPDARAQDYIDGLGLTEREFHLVRESLDPGAHEFLVRQGTASTVCRLDLSGFDDALAVISGRVTSLAHLQAAIDANGPDPARWLAHFVAAAGGAPVPASSPAPDASEDPR